MASFAISGTLTNALQHAKNGARDLLGLVQHADVVAVEERQSEGDDRRGEDEVDVETSTCLQHRHSCLCNRITETATPFSYAPSKRRRKISKSVEKVRRARGSFVAFMRKN